MHCFLRRQHSDIGSDEKVVETLIYGPSTSNQVVLLKVAVMFRVD